MTLYAWARRRHFPSLPRPENRIFEVAPDARVMARCHWQAERASAPALLLLHGLEGSANAPYVRGIADTAWRLGFSVVRLNQRNCGHTEHLAETLYHSGLTGDPMTVLGEIIERDRVPSVGVIGYSLGGNLALKLAGEFGDAAPPELAAVVAVSPAMDLARCNEALERPANRLYALHFLVDLKRRIRLKAEMFPERYDARRLWEVRTIRQFDDRFTAPAFGFANAEDYYNRASALRIVDRIRVPTLILTAMDDPFVPYASFCDPALTGNPAVRVVLTPHGGHCAFVARGSGDGDGNPHWAETTAIGFVAERTRRQG